MLTLEIEITSMAMKSLEEDKNFDSKDLKNEFLEILKKIANEISLGGEVVSLSTELQEKWRVLSRQICSIAQEKANAGKQTQEAQY